MIKIRKGKLEWTQVMRSNDLVLGLPYNLVQFTSMQEILASWLNVDVGSYNHISDSLHIYTEKESFVGIQTMECYNTDSLRIKKEDFNQVIQSIYNVMETLFMPIFNNMNYLNFQSLTWAMKPTIIF